MGERSTWRRSAKLGRRPGRMAWALGISVLLHLGLVGLAGTAIVEPKPREVRTEVSLDLFEPPPPPAPPAPVEAPPEPEPPQPVRTPQPVREKPKPRPVPQPAPEPATEPEPEPEPAPTAVPSEPASSEPATANLSSSETGEPSVRPGPSGPDIDRIQARYLRGVRSRIERAKRYPSAARAGEVQEGRVKVRITITASGELSSAQVVKSSGYELLDQAALDAVRRAAPFGPMPPELGGSLTVVVPIDFSITNR